MQNPVVTAETTDRVCRADDIYYLALFRKKFRTPALRHRLMRKLYGDRVCLLSTVLDTARVFFFPSTFLFTIFWYFIMKIIFQSLILHIQDTILLYSFRVFSKRMKNY